MKKLLIIMTLFVSSFFLFCNKEVKAVNIDWELDFSLLNDNFYNLKNEVDSFLLTNDTYSDFYYIYYLNNVYYAHLFPSTLTFAKPYPYVAFKNDTSIGIYIATSSSKSVSDRYILDSSGSFVLYESKKSSNGNDAFKILYCSKQIYLYGKNLYLSVDYINSTVTYLYDNFQRTDTFPSVATYEFHTLYMLYNEYMEESGNKELVHKEELGKVESFYTVVIQKLAYLAETIASNYIYLSIIVIFILIFVFLLIFRRFIC